MLSSDANAAKEEKREAKQDKREAKQEKREAKVQKRAEREERREEKQGVSVPEIDAMSGGAALAIVGAAVALIRERTR